MNTRRRWAAFAAPVILLSSLALGGTSATAADIPAPPEVQTALQSFDSAPQAAMTAWTAWAATQPMTFTTVSPEGKVSCRIDSAGVTKCTMWDPKLHGKGYTYAETDYTLANHTTQIFKYHGKWVWNSYGADRNPITDADRFYGYDYWLPWLTPEVPVATSTDPNGWHVVTAQNLKPGDDQSQVTVVKVSPDVSRAQIIQQDKSGNVDARTTITIRDVPAIQVPAAKKQKV